ncbi:MAG: signal recognition particle-docking protein FtsY [Verrucomicrobia bacterium GWF2_62_7]|nr:MAG: signal recognition particle-docking protein FtsY [Verrucomicrobia bacterium GWF2_62_7]
MLGLFKKVRDGLAKTHDKLIGEIKRIVARAPRLDAESLDELEAALIGSDIGVETTMRIIEEVRKASAETREVDVVSIARRIISEALASQPAALRTAQQAPTVIVLLGVNGTGKTTSTAKLAHLLKQDGRSVLLAACDTFRAAAIEQLKIWGERTGCDVITGQYNSDSAAIAFDALDAAISRKCDFLLIDTAGRLHTKKNLMDEMAKLQRVLRKRLPDAPHETLLVLDASTGMNGLNQAREFHQAIGVSGLIVTKLDGTAKGGIVVAINRELKIPVKFIGVGEQVDDLQPFDATAFGDALFS